MLLDRRSLLLQMASLETIGRNNRKADQGKNPNVDAYLIINHIASRPGELLQWRSKQMLAIMCQENCIRIMKYSSCNDKVV